MGKEGPTGRIGNDGPIVCLSFFSEFSYEIEFYLISFYSIITVAANKSCFSEVVI